MSMISPTLSGLEANSSGISGRTARSCRSSTSSANSSCWMSERERQSRCGRSGGPRRAVRWGCAAWMASTRCRAPLGRRRMARIGIFTSAPRSSRRWIGMGEMTAPSMRYVSAYCAGMKIPGMLMEARMAGRTCPDRNTTSCPVWRSAAGTAKGRRRSSNVVNSGMSLASSRMRCLPFTNPERVRRKSLRRTGRRRFVLKNCSNCNSSSTGE